jgi:hypothetical protein
MATLVPYEQRTLISRNTAPTAGRGVYVRFMCVRSLISLSRVTQRQRREHVYMTLFRVPSSQCPYLIVHEPQTNEVTLQMLALSHSIRGRAVRWWFRRTLDLDTVK